MSSDVSFTVLQHYSSSSCVSDSVIMITSEMYNNSQQFTVRWSKVRICKKNKTKHTQDSWTDSTPYKTVITTDAHVDILCVYYHYVISCKAAAVWNICFCFQDEVNCVFAVFYLFCHFRQFAHHKLIYTIAGWGDVATTVRKGDGRDKKKPEHSV